MKRIKQFGCLVLAMVCFCIAFVMPAHAYYNPYYDDLCPKVDFTIGDVSYDGHVDAVDALRVLRKAVYIESESQRRHVDPQWFRFFFHGYSRSYPTLLACYEECYYTYFLGERSRDWPYLDARYVAYMQNRTYLADVDGDKMITAKDALLILQYAVGKIDAFPRTSLTDDWDKYWAFAVWPDDWRPGMYLMGSPSYPGDRDCYAKLSPEKLPWDFYDPANWTYLPGYYEEYILPLKEANEG